MKFSYWLMSTAMAAMTLPIAAPGNSFGLIQTAQADVYHSVANGDTLSSIAARYHANIDDLRALNGLRDTSDTASLPTMLLRVPEGQKGATSFSTAISVPALAPQVASVRETAPTGYGTVTKSVVHVVQPQETTESIATRYIQAGYNVSPESIRTKNNLIAQPSVGQRLLIPLQSQTYRAPQPVIKTAAQTHSPGRTSSRMGSGNAVVSDEMYIPGLSSTAREVTTKTPIYQSPNFNANTPRVQARRGPTVLASRGYFPSPELDGARVLGRNEEAPVVGSAPQSRMGNSNVAARVQSSPLARVAMVSLRGARIRRLPESSAATLYQCTMGTELAVTQQNGTWSAVLMSDRSTGWVPTRYLRFTGASVDISSQVLTNAAAARSRYNSRGLAISGDWRSDNPMVAHALTWLGTRYVYGGTGRNGIDCSALVQTSFRANGIRLPRTAAEQARVGTPIDVPNLQPGDRLYFSASGRRIDHTGLYMGNGLFVHASGSGRGVIVSRLTDSRNWNIFVGARR
ncbi:MAG TPA: NlpC/P60 family protein [Abditibacteriaceae bacterium]|jgi:cell wall-associated NlpC family hydrolase